MMKTFFLATGVLFLASCGSRTPEQNAPSASEASLPTELFSTITETPISVQMAKGLPAGQDVVVKGKIMGNSKPFVSNRASFLMGNPDTLVSCDIKEGDGHCKTPWDACCETVGAIQAGTLNIQVIDAEGKVLKTELKGKGGLKELAHVIVKGKLDRTSTAQATIVNAEVIQVLKE